MRFRRTTLPAWDNAYAITVELDGTTDRKIVGVENNGRQVETDEVCFSANAMNKPDYPLNPQNGGR